MENQKTNEAMEQKAIRLTALLRDQNSVSQAVLNNFMAAVDFIESKGLKSQFNEYLLSRKGVN